MTSEWLAFLGGILMVLIGGLIASIVQRQNEAATKKEKARLGVYFQLLDLNQNYFWVASSELRGEPAPPEAVAKCREVS